MPAVIRYPWRELAIGASQLVRGAPSKSALYSSLRHFRDSCRALGYTDRCMPRFAFTWHEAPGGMDVTITRLEDGPLDYGPHMKGRTRLGLPEPARAVEQRAILAAFDAHLEHQQSRQRAGLPREMTPLDLITRSVAFDKAYGTDLAGTMADLDSSLLDIDCVPARPSRRAGDDPDSPLPPRACPDLPYDQRLASRLAQHRCRPTQV